MIVAPDFWPRNCQELMRDFMLDHPRCNIWADPGTGKTGAGYTVIDILKLLGSNFFPVLVLGPKKVCTDVWPREQRKWRTFRDIKAVCLAGREDEFDRIEQLRRPADVYIINYDLLTTRTRLDRKTGKEKIISHGLPDLFKSRGLEWPFKTVIADEATRLRNFRLRNGGQRARELALVSKHVGRWINFTGTPSPDGKLIDLWGQMWFIDRGERLGRTFGEYKKRYFDENQYSREITLKPGADIEIAKKIRDVTLYIRAADYFDLPKLNIVDIPVQLGDAAMRAYMQMESTLYANGVEAANSAVMTGKCLQIAGGALYTDDAGSHTVLDDAKLDALESLLEDMNGQPLLTAYHWRFQIPRVMKRFPYTREIKTSEDIDDWNAKRIRHALVHPASIGHGVDLALGGNHLAFLDPWWDLETYLQIIERIGPTRQAQHNTGLPVWIHNIVAQGTLDEAVVARRTSKKRVQDVLMDRMKR